MTRDDLPLVHDWHQRPHVVRWWTVRKTLEEVEEHYLPTIEGTEPTDHYIALLEDEPIGMIQSYQVSDYPDWAALTGVGPGVAGIDLFIGDEALTGRGIGTEMISRFVDEVVFAEPATTACVADPDVQNLASMRAFEKAGFRVVREFVDPEDGELHALVRRDRA
jgi:aminoglycoside 6'-N-acetyltransferase-1b/aminoglycoside 6'-N-acetyltransferase-2